MSDHVEELSSIPLFSKLNYREREVIAGFVSPASYKAGSSIVREGESGRSFYVITSGSVEVTSEGKLLRVLGAGDFFGEMAVLGEGSRTATVTARSDVELWAMLGADLTRLNSDHPDVAAQLAAAVTGRSADRSQE